MTALVCVLTIAVAGCTAPAAGTDKDTGSAAPTASERNEIDLADLQSRWWTWASSAPTETNPVADTTGEFCADRQPADVWLLAGSFGETVSRRCTVPAGQPLAGPAVNQITDVPAVCDAFMREAWGEVELDGSPLDLSRADLSEITVTGVPDNPVLGAEGTFRTHGCGLWFTVPSLTPGQHTLVIKGGSTNFELEVDYDLTVTAAT
ncbi:hypothetical protein BU204_32375 [Actinophytocola xanthii]|uniref:Uncharacterized protein n=2 Tax=Actinophytocola xanthii TaxID=1912961 RepID=A0A1Q8C6C4_9PSEU|nr:hypothetical protein BU204_32375 [Actinophytocola xanthii]